METTTGDVLAMVKGCFGHYQPRSGYAASKTVAKKIELLPAEGDRSDYSSVKLQLIPCGQYVVLFQYNNSWVCATTGCTDSEYWLRFVRSHLESFGV